MRGSGLSFPVADGTGEWVEFHRDRIRSGSRVGRENGWSSTDADVDESGTSAIGARSGARLRSVEEEEGEMV